MNSFNIFMIIYINLELEIKINEIWIIYWWSDLNLHKFILIYKMNNVIKPLKYIFFFICYLFSRFVNTDFDCSNIFMIKIIIY
jgi:hypothetical protein